jgi:hypothetical protein
MRGLHMSHATMCRTKWKEQERTQWQDSRKVSKVLTKRKEVWQDNWNIGGILFWIFVAGDSSPILQRVVVVVVVVVMVVVMAAVAVAILK